MSLMYQAVTDLDPTIRIQNNGIQSPTDVMGRSFLSRAKSQRVKMTEQINAAKPDMTNLPSATGFHRHNGSSRKQQVQSGADTNDDVALSCPPPSRHLHP